MLVHSILPSPIGDETIPLHLTKPQSTVPRSTLGRLPCQRNSRTVRACMDLVYHHVLQLLIVDWSKEYVTHQWLSAQQGNYHSFWIWIRRRKAASKG